MLYLALKIIAWFAVSVLVALIVLLAVAGLLPLIDPDSDKPWGHP